MVIVSERQRNLLLILIRQVMMSCVMTEAQTAALYREFPGLLAIKGDFRQSHPQSEQLSGLAAALRSLPTAELPEI